MNEQALLHPLSKGSLASHPLTVTSDAPSPYPAACRAPDNDGNATPIPTIIMPPLFSSLAAALRPRQRHPQHHATRDDEHHTHTLDFPLSLTSNDTESLQASSSHQNQQSAAGGMAVAFSLFLLGRSASKPLSDAPPPPIVELPVHFDLLALDGVRATHIETSARTPSAAEELEEELSNGIQSIALPDSAALSTYEYHDHLALASDMRASKRHVAIVTTAAIPWMTGTSVNPTLRAIYMAKDGHDVTLVVPWLRSTEEQAKLFAAGSSTFATQEEQAAYIQRWISEYDESVAGVVSIMFYEGVYSQLLGSIMPVGTLTDFLAPLKVKDVAILEEPEHLTWHHSGKVWTDVFQFVVGIIHTNYIEYVRNQGFFGPHRALGLLFLNMWVCRGYCHRIIKLSDAVQEFPNSITSNVHGVQGSFIDIGKSFRDASKRRFTGGFYFMAKVLWTKGYKELFDLLTHHHTETENLLTVDLYGSGRDATEVSERIEAEPALQNVSFHNGVANHTSDSMQAYKVLVNASKSEVVCTVTAEALAMGKFVLCLKHPSNTFFETFANCYTYSTPDQFAQLYAQLDAAYPEPLSERDAYRLTWVAATERLYDAMRLPIYQKKNNIVDGALGVVHSLLSKVVPQPGSQIKIKKKLEKEKQRQNEVGQKEEEEAQLSRSSQQSNGNLKEA